MCAPEISFRYLNSIGLKFENLKKWKNGHFHVTTSLWTWSGAHIYFKSITSDSSADSVSGLLGGDSQTSTPSGIASLTGNIWGGKSESIDSLWSLSMDSPVHQLESAPFALTMAPPMN